MTIRKMWEFIKDAPRNIKYGTQNIIAWFYVIWNDRDWDQWFLYKIIQFKLKQMEQLQRKYGNSINSNDYADQMKLCINLLGRLIEDDYLNNALEPHEKKWGESKFTFTPLPDSDLSTLNIEVEKAQTEKEKKQENKERMIIYNRTDELRKQDLDMLFKNMRKYCEGWWD